MIFEREFVTGEASKLFIFWLISVILTLYNFAGLQMILHLLKHLLATPLKLDTQLELLLSPLVWLSLN